MKKIYVLLIVAVITLGGSTPQKSPTIEGAWKLVSVKSVDGTSIAVFPGDWSGSQMKMWSKDHFAFVGYYKNNKDTIIYDSYGGGTYTLKGNRYDETILYHTDKKIVGQTIKMVIEIKNDSLFQTWPVDNNGKINPTSYTVEKYVKF